jgi:hypothetical protein
MASRAIDPVEAYAEEPANDVSGMSDDELVAALQREEEAAVSYRDSVIADEQAAALDFYEAEPFGDEEEGRSQIVTPDVAEVVDYMTISVARTCVSGDRVVEFEAKRPGQEDAAQEATEAVTQTFMRDQDGYKIILGWLQSGLLEKIGVTKTYVERTTVKRREWVQVDDEQLTALDAGMFPGVRLMEYSKGPEGSYQARVEREEERKRYRDITVPSEEFLFSARARHEDDCGYVAQRSHKTLSDLVEMGFDRETVAHLPADNGTSFWSDTRSYSRWRDQPEIDPQRDGALREVLLFEEYIRVDRDGDGVAELLKVFRVSNVILDIEEVDEQPFVVFCPFPRAHRLVGNSLADKVMDIQRTRSVILRQQLDGLYLSNRPRGQIDENSIGDNTIDDWLTPGPGVLVRTKGQGVITPLADGFDVSKGLGMLEFITGERESRTGITRLNQGLDADALNKTATGTALMQAQGQQIEEFIARNFAEALARLFAKKLRLMKAEGEPIMVKLDGEIKEADPSGWDEDMTVSVRVGLGSGRKEQRLQYWQLLVEDQMALKASGSSLVSDENMYRVRDGAVRDMGLGLPSEYYTDPATQEPQPPPPDPEMAKAQAQATIEAEKVKVESEKAQRADQLKADQLAVSREVQLADVQEKAAITRWEAEQKANREMAAREAEAALAVERQQFDMALATRRAEFDMALAEKQAKAKSDEAGLPKYRPGGDLDK